MDNSRHAEVLRVGVGGPVGSGKTALVDCLCKSLRDRLDIAVVTNDMYFSWVPRSRPVSGVGHDDHCQCVRVSGSGSTGLPSRNLSGSAYALMPS